MKLRRFISEQKGYTLVEALVAMTLFVGVLIPVIGMLGNFLIEKKYNVFQEAIIAAQTEMNKVIAEKHFIVRMSETSNGLLVLRKIKNHGTFVDIQVSVRLRSAQDKNLVELRKTFLVPE